jgi:hypothetical protein
MFTGWAAGAVLYVKRVTESGIVIPRQTVLNIANFPYAETERSNQTEVLKVLMTSR